MAFVKLENAHYRRRGEPLLLNLDCVISAVPSDQEEGETVVYVNDGTDSERPYTIFVDVPFEDFCAACLGVK